ncbi:MAG TPA: FixG Ig-like domain-containing protein, partial [Saprospiraceae bacterium]|nr:FixG Ig-like domain-containing protein [Saprospiraceae bacterium]
YQKVDDTHISNLYNYQIINKTHREFPVEFKLASGGGIIKLVGNPPVAKADAVTDGAMFIEMEKSSLDGRKTTIVVEVYDNGKLVDKVKTNFLGPVK